MEQVPPIGTRTRLLLQGGARPFRLSPFEGVVLLGLFAATLFGGYSAYAKLTDLNSTPPTPPTYIPAFRTTLASSVSTTGSVQSNQQVTLTFGTSGKIKEFLVGLGATVEAGQPLARIDDSDLQQAVKSAKANLDSAQARYNAAGQGPSAADLAAAQQSLNSASAQLANAEQNILDLKAKPTFAELAAAQQGLLQAQNALQTANDNLAKAQNDVITGQSDLALAQQTANDKFSQLSSDFTLLQSAWNDCAPAAGFLKPPLPPAPLAGAQPASAPRLDANTCSVASKLTSYNTAFANYGVSATAYTTALQSITSKQAALTNAQNTLNSGNLQRSIQSAQIGLLAAQLKLAETQAGPKQADLDAAQRSIDTARAALDSAQAKYNALFEAPKPETILPLQASVEQARAQLESAKQNLAAATIVAPFSGQISQVSGEVGSQVGANTAVFVLLNPTLIRIDANVDQSDITNLKVGQSATATFDALAGRGYQATITAIGLTPTVQQGIVTYVVTFGVETSRLPEGLPIPAPGMTASMTITTSRTENALVVPARAIRRSGATATVTVRTAAGDEQRRVTTGATNGTLTEVTGGLNEGDEVLVSLGSAAAAAQRTTGTNSPFQQGGGQFVIPAGSPGR